MMNKKKNVFIILLLIIVVLPILLSFVKCDNGNSEMDPSPTIQAELKSPKRLKKARSYIGTAVPNTGYVENIYFNTNLTTTEVDNYLSELDIELDSGSGIYVVAGVLDFVGGMNVSRIVAVSKLELDSRYHYSILIGDYINGEIYDIYSSFIIDDIDYEGWKNSELTYRIDGEMLQNFSGIIIGTQNNIISNVISSTPFIQDNRSGLQIIFEEIGSGLIELATAFINLFVGLVPVFWVNNQPTIISILVLASVALNIGFWGINKLLKLLKMGLGGRK